LEEPGAIKIFHAAVDRGINFSDNSWDYNQWVSEKRVGKTLKNGYRDKVFVMTKFDGRTKGSALKQLDESLQRLELVITGVDSMDILDQAFEAAKTYTSLSKADMEGILKKTVTVAADGKYEPFKITPIFASTAAHPEWLGYAAQP
jgi:aryl-alcohol dehydrogenase-like predicted oxidoreductase